MGKWFCAKCGTPNAEDQEVCTGCGLEREEGEDV